MRRLAFVARLLFGLFGSMALIVAPATLAVAQEGKQHEMIKGEVENVDASVGKITLKHGPIKSLGMDQGMTMVFSIDPSALKGIKAGDKVLFQPERVNGQLTVTKIEKGK
jgi:Cu/Ag efflux protein CusF